MKKVSTLYLVKARRDGSLHTAGEHYVCGDTLQLAIERFLEDKPTYHVLSAQELGRVIL